MSNSLACCACALALLSLTACEDQRYVNPGTVRLTISSDKNGSTLVDSCHYVPVLLGSQVEARYDVDADLAASLTITRSELTVTFSGAAAGAPAFRADPKNFVADSVTVAEDPPPGYSVELRPGCTPDEG